MAKYPIKMLKDEEGTPFVPLVSTEALRTPEGVTIEEELEKKIEPSNLIAGTDITLSVDGNNITINNASKGVLIDNLTTETPGIGSLDAHQGKVLKDMIPEVVNNVTSTDSDKALSAYQGYLLSGKVVPTGGKEGQVLKKSSDTNWSLEWGDAADPNAIVGDGSIKKIVELTYEEYQALEAIDPDTEYHIYNVENGTYTYISEGQIQEIINDAINANNIIDERHYPTLLNNWHNFQGNHPGDSSNYSTVCYYKDRGRVYIEGLLEIAENEFTYQAPVFYLPEGYHNDKTYILTCWGSQGPVEVRIRKDGAVVPWGPVASQHTWVDLGSLSFRL